MSKLSFWAFEYVLGTMNEEERRRFEEHLKENNALAEHVRYWENYFIAFNDTRDTLPPQPNTWVNIKNQIKPEDRSNPARRQLINRRWLPWSISFVTSMALVILISMQFFKPNNQLMAPVDYVAVLLNTEGSSVLTAITEGSEKQMWLEWGQLTLADNKDAQIWAKSKSDGQIRSIAVIDHQGTRTLTLSNADWRLIKDAHSLILTEEEPGGSALDEPSDIVLAKGICVRLNQEDKAT